MRPTNLTEGSSLRALTGLAMPMLVGAVLQNLQSLIDLFWVGRLGPTAVASVAMSGTVLMILFPMLMGVSTGTVALVARATGAGRPQDASAAAGQSLALALILGGASAVLGLLFSRDLFRLLGAAPDVVAGGSAYLRVSLLGSFTVFALFIGNAALQGAGDAVTPMWIMGVANVVNMVLDPLFIFGLGPVPAMGVRGAAIATVLAQGVAACLSLSHLLGGRGRLHVRLAQWRPDLALSWRILRIGIPNSGQMVSRSLVSAVMMAIVASCGTAAVAAYGIGLRLHMIIMMPAFAIGGAVATMVGQNLGAGRPQRARRAAWLGTGVDAAFMAVAALVLALAAPTIIRVFNADPEVVSIGSRYLRIVSPFYVFSALGIVLGRALNGAGDTIGPMVITIVCLWGLQAPLALWFAQLWQPATQGIWWAMSATMTLQALLTAAWFETGRWMKARV